MNTAHVRKGSPLYLAARQMLQAGMSWEEAHHLVNSEFVIAALEKSRGNVCKAAILLNLHRNTLGRQLQVLNLTELAKELRTSHKRQRRILFPGIASA